MDYLTQKLFGTSSEKSKTIAGQMNLFDEAEQKTRPQEEERAAGTVTREHTRSSKCTNGETFKGVPSRDKIIPLSEGQRRCADCGSEMDVIGKEFCDHTDCPSCADTFSLKPCLSPPLSIFVDGFPFTQRLGSGIIL